MHLIDSLNGTTREVRPGKWAIAKPIEGSLVDRVIDAWCVLVGKGTAVYFAEDELRRLRKDVTK